jgi:hypothetical protein
VTDKSRDIMQAIATGLDDALNGAARPKRVAFVVLTSNFGEIDGGRVNYVSNAERDDITAMLKELLARWEGKYDELQQGEPT